MAIYGNRFKFEFFSQNGSLVEIEIQQEGYTGPEIKRNLGRAPILKRESNGSVYGTSLEIFAEAKVDGEYLELYTSSATEYKVRLYKNSELVWVGYVTPELYSEPDIAPPYDVQIIATDGLGELRNFPFIGSGTRTLKYHLQSILNHTELYLDLEHLSTLKGSLTDALNISVDLDHLTSKSCYDVLQLILESLHATITQNGASWLLMRETDIIKKISGNGLTVQVNGNDKILPIAEFGSAKTKSWWPVGNLSSTVIPAKSKLTLKAENTYKSNIFGWDDWTGSNAYDAETDCYKLAPGDAITQRIQFSDRIAYRLLLNVKARCEGGGDEAPNLGVTVKISGFRPAGQRTYWLFKTQQSDSRRAAPYIWLDSESPFNEELDPAQDGATAADAKNIEVVIPIYYNTARDYAYASDIEVSISNPNSSDSIIIYDISLVKYEQVKGYETKININNNAREEGGQVEVCILSKTAQNYVDSSLFMYGVPSVNGVMVNSWSTALFAEQDLTAILALDYATSLALPRVNLTGILNIPNGDRLPMLFVNNGAYYILERYSYNLKEDELDVSLISIPNAEVIVNDIVEVPITETTGTASGSQSGTGGSAGSGGTAEIVIDNVMSDSSENPVQNRIIKGYADDLFSSVNKKVDDVHKYADEINSKTTAADKALEMQASRTTMNTISGYWQLSSDLIGSIVTATRVSDGAWACIEQPVKAGETYIITGTGGNTPRPYALVDSRMKLLAIADAGVTVNGYTLTVAQDGKLYCSMLKDASYSIIKVENKSIAFEKNEEAHQFLYDEIHPMREGTQDITPYFGVGYFAYSSVSVGTKTEVTKGFGASWHCVRHAVKAGEEYVITGAGGGGARLYCVVNNEGIIKAIAEAGAVLYNHAVKVEEDGVLYCSCDAAVIADYSVIRKYYVEIVKDGIDVTWKNGSFEFGRTCDCDYTAPTIDRWSYPELGKRVATINAWYDELVAEYPQYVFREDCDAVMASLGISKPAAIAPYPMYIYKFISPKAPNSSGMNPEITSARHIKAFIITGTHPEYMGIWDMLNTMRLVCRSWRSDKNLEELRWNADIYIIPCFNPYGIDNGTRTNENAVDLNRNAPTSDWYMRGEGTQTYSGESAGSEYSTKVLMHYLETIKPQVFIDHHNTNVGSGDDEGDGKNMIYTHCAEQIGIDVASVVISQMTRKWKDRYTDTFPSVEADPTTMFGFTSFDDIAGSLGKYATEQGALGSTYESNNGLLYKNGEYSTANRVHDNELISTCATEGFINYLVRILKVYSEQIGVQQNK